MNQETKIVFKDFNFFYGKLQAIKDLNMEIPANEIIAVLGPANSGTTTFLRSINRLNDLVPGARMEGQIIFNGKNINAPEIDVTDLRRRVGMVFDVPTPLPMSIYDNVAYGPRLGRLQSRTVLDERVEKALQMAALWDEVKDRLNSPAMRLSGGQKQRLCIARVLALEPEAVFGP
jgi:phosphate transport system ATP-binding protein